MQDIHPSRSGNTPAILPSLLLSASLLVSSASVSAETINVPTGGGLVDVPETAGACRDFVGVNGGWDTVRYLKRDEAGMILDFSGFMTPQYDGINTVGGVLCDSFTDIERVALPPNPNTGHYIKSPFVSNDIKKITTGGVDDTVSISGPYNNYSIGIYGTSIEVYDQSNRKIIFDGGVQNFSFYDKALMIGTNTSNRDLITTKSGVDNVVYAGTGSDIIEVKDTSGSFEIYGDNPWDTNPNSDPAYVEWDTLRHGNGVSAMIDMRPIGSRNSSAVDYTLSGIDAIQFGGNTTNVFIADGDNQGVTQVSGGYSNSYSTAYFPNPKKYCSVSIENSNRMKVSCPDSSEITLVNMDKIYFDNDPVYISLKDYDPDTPNQERRHANLINITPNRLPSGYCGVNIYTAPNGSAEVNANLQHYIDERAEGADHVYPNGTNQLFITKENLDISFAGHGYVSRPLGNYLDLVDNPLFVVTAAVMYDQAGGCSTYDNTAPSLDRHKSEVFIMYGWEVDPSKEKFFTRPLDEFSAVSYIASSDNLNVRSMVSDIMGAWQGSSNQRANDCSAEHPDINTDSDNNGMSDYYECITAP